MSFMPAYLTEVTDFGTGSMFAVTITVLLSHMIALPLWGALSDRIGRKPVIMTASLGLMLVTYPAFKMIAEGGTLLYAMISAATLGALIAAGAAPLFAFMAEMFPTRVRASSVSIGYNFSVMTFGGTAPFIATFLIGRTGSSIASAFYLVAAAAATALTLALAPTSEKRHRHALRQT